MKLTPWSNRRPVLATALVLRGALSLARAAPAGTNPAFLDLSGMDTHALQYRSPQ